MSAGRVPMPWRRRSPWWAQRLPCGQRARRSAVAVAAVAAVVGSVGATGAAAARAVPATFPALRSSGTPGCGRPVPTGSTTLHLAVGARRRLVIVHVPLRYRATTHVPLVLNLHGSGSTARQQEGFSGMDATADQHGFIVAYPQALIASGDGFDWNVPGVPLFGGTYPPKSASNDVTFLTDLVHDMAAKYCIDPGRVYATGMSGGGRMASQLACDAPSTFAAVAPVAGLRFPSPCPATRPVPVIAFQGTADPIDPYRGNGQAYWTYSVPTAAQRWASRDGCQPVPHTTSDTGYTLSTYSGCTSNTSVELYALEGEGHEWPGGSHLPARVTAALGPQTRAVNANETMWTFFASHPRRPAVDRRPG